MDIVDKCGSDGAGLLIYGTVSFSSLKRECRPLQNECGLIGKSAESLHNANICFVQNNLFFFASRLKRLKRYADFVHVVYDLCFTCLLNKHCLVSRTDLCAMGRAAD